MSIIVLIAIIGGGFGAKTDYPVLNNGEVILFAHRGYPDTSVENSSAAFKNCLAIGFNAIETDIRCTKDGKLVLFHDESCERLLGIEETSLKRKAFQNIRLHMEWIIAI